MDESSLVSSVPDEEPPASLHATRTQKAFILPLLIVTVMITGTTTLIFVKWAAFQSVPVCGRPDCPVKVFDAPFLQLVIQTYGETLCLGIHIADKMISRNMGREHGLLDFPCASDDVRHRARWVNWIVPAVCDCAATLLLLYAIRSTPASTVQVLRNTQLLMCALISIFWLRRHLKVHNWIGILILTVGLLVTTASQLRSGDAGVHKGHNPLTGVLFTISSTVAASFCMVFVEHIYKRFRCSPFEAIGYMGIISLVIALIAMLIAHWADIERIDEIWYQLLHNRKIGEATGLYLMSVALFNGAALSLIKIGSAMLTAVVFSSRQTLMWVAELCLGWKSFTWADFLGMLLVLSGLLVYAGVTVCQCWPAFAKFQNKELQMHCHCVDPEEEEEEDEEETTSQHSGTTASNSAMSTRKKDKYPRIIMTGHETSFEDDRQELWIYVEKEIQFTQVETRPPEKRQSHTPPASARPK